jgi:tetratricopeptide (TPR) repeat protein
MRCFWFVFFACWIVLVVPASSVAQTAETLIRSGVKKERSGDLDGAYALYDEAISVESTRSAGYDHRGMIEVRERDLGHALPDLNSAIRLGPQDSPDLYIHRAWCQFVAGNLEAMQTDLQAALAMDPNRAHAYALEAALLMERGDLDGAISNYSKAAELGDAAGFRELGIIYYLKGEWAKSLDAYGKALDSYEKELAHSSSITTRSSICYTRLFMWLLMRKQNSTEVPDALLSGLEPAVSDTWQMAWVAKIMQFLLGKIEEKELLSATASDRPYQEMQKRSEAWYYCGEKRLFSGNKDGAADAFRRCVSVGARGDVERSIAMWRLKCWVGQTPTPTI